MVVSWFTEDQDCLEHCGFSLIHFCPTFFYLYNIYPVEAELNSIFLIFTSKDVLIMFLLPLGLGHNSVLLFWLSVLRTGFGKTLFISREKHRSSYAVCTTAALLKGCNICFHAFCLLEHSGLVSSGIITGNNGCRDWDLLTLVLSKSGYFAKQDVKETLFLTSLNFSALLVPVVYQTTYTCTLMQLS